MTHAKRGRVARRGFYFCTVAALGLAVSGCGGNTAGSSAGTSAESSAQAASTGATAGSSSSGSANSGANSGAISPASNSGSTAANSAQAGSGTITLNWVAPTENVDGTALTNLAGYNIHYGTATGQLTQTISISNPGIATYVVSNLAPGTYYFAVAAVNSAGAESQLSAEVSTKVN